MKSSICLVLASLLAIASAQAQITPGFEPGNLAVLRVGNGTASLASSGDPVFLDEYTTHGVLTNSVAIPASGPTALIIGSATSEGAISRAVNGNYIVMVGYNTNFPYTSSLANSTSAAVPRGLSTIDFNGNYSFITNTKTAFSANNIRGGTSDGAGNFWAVGANSGTVYLGLASPPATVQSALANNEVIGIFDGNLCFSEQKTAPFGVYAFTGTPVAADTSATLLFATGSGSTPYAFAISPDNTVAYVADDRAGLSGGGIQKYTNNGATVNPTWGLAYTLGTGTSSTVGARGLTVSFGVNPVIYATTADATNNRLIAITDTGADAVATVLATAPNNEIFRGVQFTPQGDAPAVTTALLDQHVSQGQDAVFSVGASGSGVLHYLWTSNTTAITAWETDATLTLPTGHDAPGSFTVGVLVSNSWGTAKSSAILTVTSTNAPPPPPVITSEPAGSTVNAGGTATFTVGATGTALSYQWRLNSTNLTDGVSVSGSTTPTLTLSDVFGASAGSYTVVVSNAGGDTNSTPAVLTVIDPYLASQPTGHTYLAGGAFSLSASAIGTGLAYQWIFNGTDIPGATNAQYTASNATPAETGGYALIVTGTYGSVTSSVASVIIAATRATLFPTNLVVLRAGDGVQTLINSGNTLFLDQFTPKGGYVGTMYLPDNGPSALLVSGVASSEGFMTRSGDGRFLAVGGYNVSRGALSGSLSSSSSTNVPRAIGTIDGVGAYSLAATITNKYSGDNLRAGATDGANNFWGAGSGDGTWYFGDTAAPDSVQTSIGNTRVVNVENGALIFSTQSGVSGLYSLGALPTGTAVTNLLFATGKSSSPEDFVFNPANDLAYVADDSNSGGIQRWELSGGVWNNVYTLGTGAAGVGARSLAVDFSGANPIIYAVTAESSASRLIAVTDTGASSLPATVSTSPANEWYRAVKFAPVISPFPAPSLTAVSLTGAQFSFNVVGVPGYQYVVQASADLKSWQPMETNAAPFTFTVTNARVIPQQYFRAYIR